MNRLWMIVLLCTVLQVTAFAVPEYINYQARIFDATGAPMQGTYAISFAIFDASREGNMVWGPFACDGLAGQGHADTVVVWDGWFNVILGPKDQDGDSILTAFDPRDGKPRFVEIRVQGETISPRQQFLMVPYAMESYHAMYASSGVPPGSILAYYGLGAPAGWLLCDGSPIPPGAQYDVLRTVVGPNTPDLRGRMILMADPGATVLAHSSPAFGATDGEEMHTLTIAEMPSHNHVYGDWKYLVMSDGTLTVSDWDSTANEPNLGYIMPMVPKGLDQPHNNMPPYIALNWIIKY